MKKRRLLYSIILIADISFGTLRTIDKIVAIVNNDIILKSDIDNMLNLTKLNKNHTNQQFPNKVVLYNQILEHLIINQIILQIGQKMDLNISDEQLNQIINNIAINNNITMAQMQDFLIHDGISYTNYCDQIRKEILISEIKNNEIQRRINILPHEIDLIIKQINNQNNIINNELNLSHILISLPEHPTKNQIIEADNLAQLVIQQMHNGIDLNKIMTINSTNHQMLNYNNIGWKYIQELPSIFTKSLSEAKKDDIVGPIKSGIGLHILKVNDVNNKNQYIPVRKVHLRHILLKPSLTMNSNQIQKRLEQIATDIRNGKITFINAAKKFSQDFDSANNGGDLGWVTTDIYNSAFHNILSYLNKGQLSAPIRSASGWHLIEVLDVININKIDVMQRDKIYKALFNSKFLEEEINWIQEQRANSYVKILNN